MHAMSGYHMFYANMSTHCSKEVVTHPTVKEISLFTNLYVRTVTELDRQ